MDKARRIVIDLEMNPVSRELKAVRASLSSNIESTHPGYDEYRYDLAEIGHNPYELASYLTVLFEDYTRAEVQSTLQSLFAQQYTLTLTPEVEIRTRTETRTGTTTSTDPVTGETTTSTCTYEVEVEYEYHILNVKLTNKGLGAVIRASGLTTEQADRYDVLMTTSGNRSELFGEDVYGVTGGEYTDYDIPGEALTDERFRRMITEAEKYLGYPYVWGGSSPSTSFDCSGFVSWVINHCGNGWSVGRLGAKGLKNICDIIPSTEAKPVEAGKRDAAGVSAERASQMRQLWLIDEEATKTVRYIFELCCNGYGPTQIANAEWRHSFRCTATLHKYFVIAPRLKWVRFFYVIICRFLIFHSCLPPINLNLKKFRLIGGKQLWTKSVQNTEKTNTIPIHLPKKRTSIFFLFRTDKVCCEKCR